MQEQPRHDRGVSPSDTVARAFEALGVPLEHDAAAEREAAELATPEAVRAALEDPLLVDLSALPFVTIDNVDSRDLDQALHIAREDGDYRVRYALADAARYVRPGSALFAAALARGTSYYTPLVVAPMLPRLLSEDLVSLNPEVERRALVFDMRLDARARVLGTTVTRARIRSRAKLDYRGVQAFLDGRTHPDDAVAAEASWAASLRLLRELGRLLVVRGRERGVVRFDRSEVRVEVTGSPPRFVARERERLEVEEWNAQISLLCNTEGATLLAGLDDAGRDDGRLTGDGGTGSGDGLQPIYRVHDAPLDARLRELRRRLDDWTTLAGLGDRWRWAKGQSLADYVDALPDTPREAGRVRAVQRQILVRQRASEYRAEPGRHHALALDGYARFSSPMREVVGIFTHKELLEALAGCPRGEEIPTEESPVEQSRGEWRSAEQSPIEGIASGGASGDTVLRDAVIASANAARRRQKALDKRIAFAVIADLLDADLAHEPVPSHAGTVLGVREGGAAHLYVGIDALSLDLKVYGEDLARRHGTPYAFEPLCAVPADGAKPAFLLGDAVSLRAAGYDETRGRFALDVTPRGEAARRERRRARRA